MVILELINMHGYGQYVWPCYGITAILIGYNILMPLIAFKKATKKLNDK